MRCRQRVALLGRASSETGLPEPRTLAGWADLIDAWAKAAAALSAMTPAIYELDLQAACEALAPAGRGGAGRLWAALTSGRYRAARAQLRAALPRGRKLGDRDLYSCAVAARDSARKWAGLGGRGIPRAPRTAGRMPGVLRAPARPARPAGSMVRAGRPGPDAGRGLPSRSWTGSTLTGGPWPGSPSCTGSAPRCSPPGSASSWPGWRPARRRRNSLSGLSGTPGSARSWTISSLTDLSVGSFSAEAQDKAVREFSDGDRRHIETTSARVRRAYAENAVRARDEFKDQAALVQHQAGLKRRHLPVRDFVRNAADVLLALKPCWAMSPLVVSQLLPPQAYFDVVIFDEASQITPADAVTSILRGRQLVVAGDDKQLPPTAFFVSGSTEDDADQPEPDTPAALMAGTAGFESILDALGSVLGFRQLTWHYRSRDERLIAFSNAHIYDRTLITFPGIGGEQRPALRARALAAGRRHQQPGARGRRRRRPRSSSMPGNGRTSRWA